MKDENEHGMHHGVWSEIIQTNEEYATKNSSCYHGAIERVRVDCSVELRNGIEDMLVGGRQNAHE